FYYMSTKFFSDGAVHAYFNPYENPYQAFMNYMNVLSDFEIRLKTLCPVNVHDEEMNRLSESIENRDSVIRELQEKLTKLEKKAGATGRKRVIRTEKTASAAAVKKAAAKEKTASAAADKKAAAKEKTASAAAVKKAATVKQSSTKTATRKTAAKVKAVKVTAVRKKAGSK
ncbi:MAG: hypothetical protein ABR560_08665, partial [Bacteroidales bacterium]